MRWRLCCLAPAATLILGIAAPARAATISVGAAIPISATEFALPVEIVGAVELLGWEFSLNYDPTDVQVDIDCDPFVDDFCSLTTTYTTEGDFFAAGAPFNLLNPGAVEVDLVTGDQTGLLSNVQGLYGGSPPAPSGDGVLAYVRFLIIGTGDSPITVVDPSVIENAPVPEPGSVWLVTIGLPLAAQRLLARKRRRR